MKVELPKTSKQLKIDKTNSSALGIVIAATAIIVFCLFSYRALLTQGAYQRRVVNEKHNTVKQLETNIESAKTLISQYGVFNSANPNAIGGKSNVPDNSPPPDGTNSRIVLDALPTSYDFPALISSLSKLLDMNKISSRTIGGQDQGDTFDNSPMASPQPVTIQGVPIGGVGSSKQIQQLIKDLERSTRPYDVVSLEITGSSSSLNLALDLNTYYQPATDIILEEKEVK